jgi:purine-nucleoside phosphorylase
MLWSGGCVGNFICGVFFLILMDFDEMLELARPAVRRRLEDAELFKDHYELFVRNSVGRIRIWAQHEGFDLREEPIQFGLTCGSGLGDIVDAMEGVRSVPYEEMGLPIPTVDGHAGELVLGKLNGVLILGFKGRAHYYEVADEPGNTGMLKVIYNAHVLAELGVSNFFVTNAAGGMNHNYGVGEVMIIRAHDNYLPSALVGRAHDFRRFNEEDYSEGLVEGSKPIYFLPQPKVYDAEFSGMLKEALTPYQNVVHVGVYAGMEGRTYETPAEVLRLRGSGVDAAGMSTIPSVVAFRSRVGRVVGMSAISNATTIEGINATDHPEVVRILESPEVKHRLTSTTHDFMGIYRERCMR